MTLINEPTALAEPMAVAYVEDLAPRVHASPSVGTPDGHGRRRPHRSQGAGCMAQRQGARAAAPLSRTVSRLQHALRRAEQERHAAVQALERQAEFMAVLAHELRAPLSPIRSAAALLDAACSPTTNAFVSGLLERQTAFASRLVDDLLDVARVRTGSVGMQRAVIDLREVIAFGLQTCRPDMDRKGQTLVVDTSPQPLWVDGDAMRLGQILNNLLGNASRYTPRGGSIGLALRIEPGHVTVIVRDTGIGIAPKDLHRIFDAYFRQDAAVSYDARGLGMGLGLSVVRDLVLAHGGRIVARSDGAGCGSQFEMSLALLPQPACGDGLAKEPAPRLRRA